MEARRAASAGDRLDDIRQLIRECDVVLQRDPQCLHTRAVRGHACLKAKLWAQAIADFGAILAVRPDDVHGRFSRGMALFKSGCVEAAHADFSRVLELNPHHVMARYARAGCLNSEGRFHRAIQDYTIALQHDERESQNPSRRGEKLPRGWHQDAEKFIHQTLTSGLRSRASCRSAEPSTAPAPAATERREAAATAPHKARRVVRVVLDLPPSQSSSPPVGRRAEEPQKELTPTPTPTASEPATATRVERLVAAAPRPVRRVTIAL
ncbi:hypothetical protein P43SY_007648 [Pythium insidiosum]|uniref:Uncharacterized protein n=1 Tax=Pythium insidiosum TaxID=114742 RepID=A0AAD5Q834_PYTIN|nr:hypothetical protein P43SY_007648 [Pythium insidiosum]